MAYSTKEWQTVQAFYERGLSLNQIIKRPEVSIKSKSQISKKAAAEGWQKETEKKQLVSLEVATRQAAATIIEQKETMTFIERNVHEALVDERSSDLAFIRSASLEVAGKALSKVRDEVCTMRDLKEAQEIIGRGKDNIFGRQPETAIQINNDGQEFTKKLVDMTDEELLAIALCG